MKASSRKAALNKVLGAIERLDPPCTIELRSAGAFPTVVGIAPDIAGGYTLDVGFRIESEEPPPIKAATPEEAGAILGSEGGKELGKLRRQAVAQWQALAITLARIAIVEDPAITNRELALKVMGGCKTCPGYDSVYKFISAARRDGVIQPRQKRLATKRHATRNEAARV